MAGRAKLTPEKQKEFLELFSKSGNCAMSCRTIGVTRNAIWYLRERDAAFDEDYKEAEAIALGLLEEEARRRALEGVDRPIYQQGNLVGYEKVYSDRMLEILLKAHAPEKYRDNQPTDTGGVTINLLQFNGAESVLMPGQAPQAGQLSPNMQRVPGMVLDQYGTLVDVQEEVVVQVPKLTGDNDG